MAYFASASSPAIPVASARGELEIGGPRSCNRSLLTPQIPCHGLSFISPGHNDSTDIPKCSQDPNILGSSFAPGKQGPGSWEWGPQPFRLKAKHILLFLLESFFSPKIHAKHLPSLRRRRVLSFSASSELSVSRIHGSREERVVSARDCRGRQQQDGVGPYRRSVATLRQGIASTARQERPSSRPTTHGAQG